MDDVGPWVPGTMVFAYGNRVSGGPMGRYARLALAEREEIVLLRRGGVCVQLVVAGLVTMIFRV